MVSIPPQTIGFTCPSCGASIPADIWRIVDVGQNHDLKRQFLRGQINVVTCPHCSQRTAVATTLAYHDPDKELYLILLPHELGLSGEEQEKTIGELTNALMTALPAEKRKGYLFQPKTFFTMRTLQQEVLRADGITPEMIQDQTERSQLIRELLAREGDDEALRVAVQEKKDQLDYKFFLLLTASIDDAKEEGDQTLADQLTALRTKLQELLQAPKISPGEETQREITVEELVEALLSGQTQEDFKTVVAIARPAFDYQFFQTLTGQIEAAQRQGEEERAKELTKLRSKILDTVDELDQEAREAMERATKLLRDILDSEDLRAAAQEKLEQMDTAFLSVLEANIVAAEKAGQEELSEKLKNLKEHVLSILEARMPPEMRLINQLLATEESGDRRKLFHEHQDLVNQQFLEVVKLVTQDLRLRNQETAAKRLDEILKEIEAILQKRTDNASAAPEHAE